MKLLLTILCLTALSFGVDNNKRTDAIDSMGIVNVRTSDTIIPSTKYAKIRCVFADIGGNVKMKIKTYRGDTITVVRTLNDATTYPWSQVVKVFPLWNGTDSTTCQVYDSTGVLRRGIGLGF